jgi:hypothetical protein
MKRLIAIVLSATIWASCKKEDAAPAKPSATNIEIGTANEKKGYVGKDFHFNADVKAADKIDSVWIQITQHNGNWQLVQGWAEYKGLRNTNVHKHFYIPTDAPTGSFDFYFRVKDQNGTLLEVKEPFTIL